jgi:hypothetical protein
MKISKSVRSLLLIAGLMMCSIAALAQFRITVAFAPPALPVYEQPLCPGDGYIWVPGYWAYDDEIDDYYWVPGTWVLAPEPGFFWTPGYWTWGGNAFVFYDGYWGPQVGFYGGINYGFGYFGNGYAGGRWEDGHFFYNRSVTNVNVTVIHNVYNTEVVNNTTTVNRVSYNGGNGGVTARPTPQEEAYAKQSHTPAVAAQTQQMQAARSDPQMRASANQGKPPVAATTKPGEFKGQGAVAAREAGAPYHPPANRGGARPAEAARPENNPPENGSHPAPTVHAKDIPTPERPTPPNTGNAKLDQKYQKQQQKLAAQQEKERQKLQQKQDQDHQRMAQQKANDTRTQQMEQRHQQQTQQLQQRQAAQRQQLQKRQAPRGGGPPKGK